MNYPNVSIVILNWNGWVDTIECIYSLLLNDYKNYNIFVVDNDSSNGSLEKIKKWATGQTESKSSYYGNIKLNSPLKVIEVSEHDLSPLYLKSKFSENEGIGSNEKIFLVKNNKNHGFSRGNNVITRQLYNAKLTDYVLLLNNDTVIKSNMLTELINTAASNNNVSIVGPKIYYYKYNGKNNVIQCAGGYVDWKAYPGYHHTDEFKEDIQQPDTEKDTLTKWVSGACMLINIDKMSPLLNEIYKFGAEDVDMCLNANKLGYSILYSPKAVVWHKGGNSRRYNLKHMLEVFATNLKLLIKNDSYWYIHMPGYFVDRLICASKKLVNKCKHEN